jgi:PAS domain S-box-containing protein
MDSKPTYEELKRQIDALRIENDAIRKGKKVIKDSEALYRLTLENISDTVIITDDQGKIIYACPNSRYIFGLSQNQIYAKETVQNLINGNICDLSELKIVQEISNIEWNVKDSFGRERFLLITIKAVSIKGGTVLYVMRDITDRQIAEARRQQSEEKYRRLYEDAAIGIFHSSFEGRFLDVNSSLAKMLGYETPQEVMDSIYSIAEQIYVEPQVRDEVIAQSLAKGETVKVENLYRRKNGSEWNAYLYLRYVSDSNGQPICLEGFVEDITERKEVEKALRESEERFRILFISAAEGILVAEIKSKKFIFANPAICQMLGYSEDELIGMNVTDIHPEGLLDQVISEFEAQARGEKVLAPSIPCRQKDGQIIYADVNTKRANINGIEYNIGLFTDITERKQAERILKEIINKNPMSIQILDKEGLTLEVNPSYKLLFGSVPPSGYSIFNDRQLLQKGMGILFDQLRNGEIVHFPELYFNAHDSLSEFPDTTWIRTIGFPLYGISEKPERFILMHENVTERKQAENKLRVAHEKMLTILDSIESTVYVADMDTYEILFMNKKMITDFSGDKTGEICFSAFRKKLEPCEFCTNDQLLDKNGNPAGVCTWHDQNPITGKFYINHDRAIEWVDSRMVRLQIATDITDLKKMETQLTQAQKMESIGTLAGGIAHDFNNILFPLIGHAEMLLDDIQEEGSIRDSLNQIYSSSLRARDLVQQILAFARHETSQLKLMKMQPIIKEAMKMIRSTIPTTISINQNLQPDCGPVTADPTQIHQIVMNLATNAYHAMEENGGELKVNLKEIQLGKDDLIDPDMSPGLYACLTIADTGIGMNKEVMARIFDPFFTTKEKGKGTGMGLSVVHGIVKRMKGEIKVYSEPGKGTEFQIYLPIARDTSERQEQNANESILMGSERVLLVDDEAAIIIMEKMILERLGYMVLPCTGSMEALEAFKANPEKFDLVITDMSMPKMSGDKLAVELIKIRPDIPILLCTGFSESMTDEKIKSLGIKGFLIKPIERKALAKKIREILD